MVDSKLLKNWVLLSTKDNGIRVYKPKEVVERTAKKIEEGFELMPDGTFIQHWSSTSGTPLSITGKYEIDGDTISTRFMNHYLDSNLKIEYCGDDLLEIR